MFGNRFIAVLTLLALPGAVSAAGDPRWQGGGQLLVAASRGSVGDVFGTGFGVEPFGLLRIDPTGTLGLRCQGGLIDYGSEGRNVPLQGGAPSVGVHVGTRRNVTTVSLGPQLSWPRGRLRPYAFATVGAAFINSRADLVGRDTSGVPIVLSGRITDTALGVGAGGGAAFAITSRVGFDAGTEYRRYHDVRSIGDATTLPNGDVAIPARRGDLDMLVFRAGVTVALLAPGGRRGPREARRATRGPR